MISTPGFVGHIKIKSQQALVGQRLLNDVTTWVNESGWKEVVSVSFETDADESYLELVPGEFQSNGLKRIGLHHEALLSDFEKDLYQWLWEIEPT